MAEKPVFHARTKHIEVHYHYIRVKVLVGDIKMVPIMTEEQIADILTKSLHGFPTWSASNPREKFALSGSAEKNKTIF